MKFLTTAVVCGLVPTLAHATDIRNDRYTTATIKVGTWAVSSTLDWKGDGDWFKVYLKAGHDYGVRFVGDGGASMAVRSPTGAVLRRTAALGEEGDTGVEIRATVDGNYFVQVYDTGRITGNGYTFPSGYEIGVTADCRAGAATTCVLPVGATLGKRMCNWASDTDAFALPLRAGVKYAFSAITNEEASPLRARILDPAGRKIGDSGWVYAAALSVTASTAGTYHAVISCGDDDFGGNTYNISLH
jgi:hypothetical protein